MKNFIILFFVLCVVGVLLYFTVFQKPTPTAESGTKKANTPPPPNPNPLKPPSSINPITNPSGAIYEGDTLKNNTSGNVFINISTSSTMPLKFGYLKPGQQVLAMADMGNGWMKIKTVSYYDLNDQYKEESRLGYIQKQYLKKVI